MLRNLAWTVVAAVILAGCAGKPESPFPRLATGDEALAYDQHEAIVPIRDLPKGKGHGAAWEDLDFLPVGTKIRTIKDAGRDSESDPGDRLVIVSPLEGEYVGVPGKMYRKHLRPVGSR